MKPWEETWTSHVVDGPTVIIGRSQMIVRIENDIGTKWGTPRTVLFTDGMGSPDRAVLASAAPDLYRSVADLLAILDVDGPIPDRARAALAKARGESPPTQEAPPCPTD